MAARLAAHTAMCPHHRLQALFADRLPTLITDSVGVLLELLENTVDVGCNLLQLAGGHGPLHLQHGIGGVVAGALSELHLDSGGAHRLGQLAKLHREFVTVRPQLRYQLVSFQGQCSMVRLDVASSALAR
jgi:hypothetical protein